MNRPTPRVIIFEDNATRADLYAHWLDTYEVTVAVTRRQASEAIDGSAAVAILDEEFADGRAADVCEYLRARNTAIQIATTSRNRGKVVPSLDVDTHLAKPIFEMDLRETVDRLARRAVYTRSLAEYFRLTMELTSAEVGEAEGSDSEEIDAIRERVSELKAELAELVASLDGNDVKAVLHDLTERAEPPAKTGEKRDSKYVPPKCPKCGVRWNEEPDSSGPIRLGSFVWRCGDCGHVQMHGHRREGDVAPFL
jgi:CheY-like chemotaxis protein